MTDDLHRFRSLCFFYACGKLDADEMAWMQHMLQSHPELQAELDADQMLVTAARNANAEAQQTSPPLLGFEDIAWPSAPRTPTIIERLQAWFDKRWHHPLPSGWAVSAVACLVIATGVQTYQLRSVSIDMEHDSRYRGIAASANTETPALEVILSDTITVADLRRVLPDLGLTIICGPDQQGKATLAVLTGTGEQALAGLKANKMLLDGHIVTGKVQCGSR